MDLEKEIISLSNNLRFSSQVLTQDIFAQLKFIVDCLKHNTKEVSIFFLDNLLFNFKKVLSKDEFETLYGGVFFIKLYLYYSYDFGNINDFLIDCSKEYLKEKLSVN